MEYYKPKDFDEWSKRDRDDYNSLISYLPGTKLIPVETLEKMSARVLQAAEQVYDMVQLDIAEESEMDELPDITPSRMKTKRIYNQGCAAFIDGSCMAKLMTIDDHRLWDAIRAASMRVHD